MNKRILVIEDETIIREDIQRVLMLNDFDVKIAPEGRTGLDIALRWLPDLIISDIMMPKLDGYGVLKALQQVPETASIPFLFLTAKSSRDDMREGMNLGADDYITKPFDLIELITAVNARIEKHEKQNEKIEKTYNNLKSSIHISIPHEIRTPLISILGFSELLQKNYDRISKENAIEMLKDINSEGRRLNKLFENFLLYAELEIISNKPQDLIELKSKVTRIAQTVAYDTAYGYVLNHNRLEDFNAELEEVDLMIDHSHFVKLNECLIENVCKFSEEGTSINVFGKRNDGFYEISYIDNGKGMTEEEIQNVEIYTQYNRKEFEQQGTGMGLALVRKITNIYDGKFFITSEKDKFTEVKISLPISNS